MALWVCRTCNHIGRAAKRWGSGLPACSACGHSTTIPVETPAGRDLAAALGYKLDELARIDREIEWRSFPLVNRSLAVVVTGVLAGTCAADGRIGVGSAVWGAIAVTCIVTIGLHFLSKPKWMRDR